MKREEVIARLILSTKRKKRDFDLVQISNDVLWLINNGENISSISHMLGISEGMIWQFLKVQELSEDLKSLVQSRIIDSVTLVQNLARFSKGDQDIIAAALMSNRISSIDIRALNPLRNQFPNNDLDNLIERLVDSKNKKISVIKFPAKSLLKKEADFKNQVKELISTNNFDSLIKANQFYELRLTKDGEKKMRQLAKQNRMSLNEFFNNLLV